MSIEFGGGAGGSLNSWCRIIVCFMSVKVIDFWFYLIDIVFLLIIARPLF